MIQNIYFGLIVAILLLLFYCLYLSWVHDTELLAKYERKIKLIKSGIADKKIIQYAGMSKELGEDLQKYNISMDDQRALHKLMHKIVFEEIAGETSIFKKVLNSAFYGMLQGAATGYITGGIPGALGGSLVFGTVSPIMKTYQELHPCDEALAI